MKALQLLLFLILVGSRVQMVKAVEEEISTRQETDRMLDKFPAPLVESSNRCRRMKTYERGRRRLAREKKEKQPQEGPKDL